MPQVVQITLGQAAVITALLLFTQWLLAQWISNRLEKSIQHEYDKKLEDHRFQQAQRQKAETIARLFSKWIKYQGKEKELLERKDLAEYYEELNKMSLEISFWIKDGKLLNSIMVRLQNKEGARDIRTIIGQTRKFILGIDDDDFDPQEITIWQ